MNNTLIAYFSASGITKGVAEKIADYLSADLFEIKPVTPYTKEDLDWTNNQSRSSIEMADRSSRPDILTNLVNIDAYETVLIGFPVWWDVAPTIINTFIEKYDLSNKKIFIFVTSGSSSVANSLSDLKDTYPSLNIIDGIRLTNNITKEDIIKFIE